MFLSHTAEAVDEGGGEGLTTLATKSDRAERRVEFDKREATGIGVALLRRGSVRRPNREKLGRVELRRSTFSPNLMPSLSFCHVPFLIFDIFSAFLGSPLTKSHHPTYITRVLSNHLSQTHRWASSAG